MSRRRLLLGPPPWQSALTLAVGAAFAVPLLLALDRGASALGPAAGLALLLGVLVRQGRQAVLLEGDVLVVRNLLRTWRLAREQVADVAVGAPPGTRGGDDALVLRLVDGRVVVADASRDELTAARARRLSAQAERDVRAWLLGLPGGGVVG